MGLEIDNLPEGDLNSLVKDMYRKLVMKRLDLSMVRKTKNPDLIEKAEIEIRDLNDDFDGLIKMQTQYNKFLKTIGEGGKDNPKEMQDLISKIRSNVGSIVSQIPKANTDGVQD